jgi:RNA polymerase sigma-70 factor (ECF subfamily)
VATTPNGRLPPDLFAELLRIARAAAGAGERKEALDPLLERAWPYLLAVAKRCLGLTLRGRTNPSDLVQRTLCVAWERFGQFKGHTQGEWNEWLRTILLRLTLPPLLPPSGELPLDGIGPASSPEEDAALREEATRLRRALGQLPEHYRQVIHWRVWEQLPWEEVARLLAPAPGEGGPRSGESARALFRRAVEQLNKVLRHLPPERPPTDPEAADESP